MFLTGFPEIWIWFQVVYLGRDSREREWKSAKSRTERGESAYVGPYGGC